MTAKKTPPLQKNTKIEFSRFLQRFLLTGIYLYQTYISPRKPPTCRFSPTCSQYAKEVITRHGWYEGSKLAVNRIARCHPLHPGGYDPSP